MSGEPAVVISISARKRDIARGEPRILYSVSLAGARYIFHATWTNGIEDRFMTSTQPWDPLMSARTLFCPAAPSRTCRRIIAESGGTLPWESDELAETWSARLFFVFTPRGSLKLAAECRAVRVEKKGPLLVA